MQNKIDEILKRFEKRFKKIDLSLERIKKFMDKIGNPHLNLPPTIHVAGTNGKGSTIAFLKAMIEANNQTCHIYTSPHLIEFNERITISGNEISNAELLPMLEEIEKASEGFELTYYELTTAAAFLAYSRNQADFLLLETGLGGRLDATNIVPKKLATIITPIGLDHTEFLGDSLTSIAKEKAGICLPETPCILAPQQKEVEDFFDEYSAKQNFPLIKVETLHELENLSLAGDFQKINASTAVTCAALLGIEKNAIEKGLTSAKWRARLQRLESGKLVDLAPKNAEIWLDGGHNPAGAKVLSESISPDILIIGMMKTKDAKAYLSEFSSKNSKLIAIRIPGEDESYDPEALAEIAKKLGFSAKTEENLEKAVQNVVLTEDNQCKILICGSLYLAGKVLEYNKG